MTSPQINLDGSPVRVQLSRLKGWKKPTNTVSVARPSRWGNEYRVMRCGDGWSVFVGKIEWWIERVGVVTKAEATVEAVRLFKLGIERWAEDEYDGDDDPVAVALAELRGKNLACWCPLDQPCHADVLLELANRC